VPRGPAPAWTARKEPVTDAYLLAAVEQAGGPGRHDTATGLYRTLVIRGLADREEADEWRRSLYRCALWLTKNRAAGISVSAGVQRDGNGYLIRFSVYSKTHGRAHVMAKHGTDRSKWPYDPRRKGAAA
jgi:hypothetical protein